MDCREVRRLLGEKPLGELPAAERADVAAHLTTCPSCRTRWDAAYESAALREAVMPRRGPEGIKEGVMARIRGETTRPGTPSGGEEPALPERIGGFVILGRLGRGGMGTVLKARQVSMDRIVALKVLPQRLAKDEAFVVRFVREAHAAAKLSHPHIVQAYDAGLADGYYYFAMEYVDGEGLDAVLSREGPLESKRALRILKQAASALWAAHEAGIVHRDIKPSNILLDSKGDVRIADFGLAKLAAASLAAEAVEPAPGGPPARPGDLTATSQGQALGTPAYLAPEVARGEPADARSDLYSLGATFFHVLAGHPPFEGHNLTEVLAQQIHEVPPPLASVAPHVAAGLCTLIDRLLCKSPAARPESARELLSLLEALGPPGAADGGTAARLRGMETPAVPPTLPADGGPRRRSRRRRAAVLAAAGVLALAAVALLASRGGRQDRSAEREKASVQTPAPGGVSFDEANEREAQALFDRARAAAERFQWEEALRGLETLGRTYGHTRVWAERTGEIARLREEVEAGLRRQAGRAKAEAPPDLPPEVAPPLPPAGQPGEWVALFDGKTLAGWRVMEEDDFGQHGKVHVDEDRIVLERGNKRTGIAWAGEFPKVDYEIALEARREAGEDCFCDVYFPIGSSLCSLAVGAWGGDMVGLSCVDGQWAPDNGTGRRLPLQAGRWYSVRLRVTQAKVQVWIDDQKVVDLSRAGRTFSPPSEHKNITWFLASWETTSSLRNIRMRRLEGNPDEWTELFDGKTLNGWRVVKKFPHAPEFGDGTGGDVHVENGQIILDKGRPVSGIAWEGAFPTINYEVAIQACRLGGAYDFANMDFPVGNQTCTLVVGGSTKRLAWLYMVDGHGFLNAELAPVTEFELGRWFDIRLRVTDGRIQAWVDGKRALDLATQGRGFSSLAWWSNEVRPFGIITNLATRGAVRSVKLRRLGPEPAPLPELPEQPGEWVSLFDGKSLDGWRRVESFEVEKPAEGPVAGGKARVEEGRLLLEQGKPFTGIACTRPLPSLEYEVSLDAMRVEGNDCFCLLAFPCGPTGGTLEIGNVHGAGVGLGVVDGGAAAANLTTRNIAIENGRWYAVRLRVRNTGVQAWIDDQKVTELSTAHHTLSLYTFWRSLAPLGLLTAHGTTGAFRNIRIRRLVPEPPAMPEKPGETVSLFDGKTLGGWRIVHEGEFARHGQVAVGDGEIRLLEGPKRVGIAWMGDFPTVDYELSLDLRRNAGTDLCEILFPIGSSRCAWNIAGWGGRGTGLGILDAAAGDQSDTWKLMTCQTGQWYRARLRVTTDRVEGWLDDRKWIDLPTAGRRFEQPLWLPIPEPLAVVTWQTALSVREIKVKLLESKPEEPPAGGVEIKTASVPISARTVWLDTGLYLKKGSPYEITATGRWGARPDWICGPEGRPGEWASGLPLPSTQAYGLIGRLGANGAPFRIGSRLDLTPAVPGRLHLRMNDENPVDNWGSLRVEVKGPMVADKDAPLLSRFTKPVAQVKLAWLAASARFPWRIGPVREGPPSQWVFSGIELQRGDRVLLSAEGSRQMAPPNEPLDADGVGRVWNRHRGGALLGRIGDHGVLFPIGRLHLLEAPEPGKLYLAINPIPAEAGQLPGGRMQRLPEGGRLLDGRMDRTGIVPLPQVAGPERQVPVGVDAPLPALMEGTEERRRGTVEFPPALAPKEAAAPPAIRRKTLAPPPEPKGEGPVVGPEDDAAQQGPPPAPKGAVPANPPPEAGDGTLTVTVFAPDGFDPNRKKPIGPAALDPKLLATLTGHAAWVVCVGFSPDGSRLVSGSRDGTVKLWDLSTGKCLATLRGHMDTVEAVAFSPDGKQILSASRDKTLRLWNAAGQPITVLRGHTDAVQSAAWLPDGQRAVSAGADASVKVWDLETGNCLRTLPCDAPSRFVTVSPDGTAVAASNDRGWIHIWDPNDGIPRQRFFGRAQGGWCLAFSPDGARLALAGDDLLVHVWEAATGRWLKSLDADGMMRCVAFSPDGKSIAAGGWRRALRIWDAKSYGLVRSLGDHLDEVRGLAFSRDGQRLATASFDGTIKIWALEPKGAGGEAWGQPVNGLRCSLALTPTALRVGHPYVLDVSVENVSDTATHLHFPTVCQAERLTIRNQHGDEVKRRPMRLYGPMPPQAFFHLIKPGERFTAQIKGRVACQSVPAADQPAAGAYRALLLDSQDVAHEIGRPGEFTAHVRFAADDKTVAQGKRSGIEPVWTGTMDSNSVAFSVRPMTSEELEVVIRAVGNGTEKEQLEAVDVLRAIADRRAVPALMGVLAKGPGPLQQAAAAALGSIHDTSAVPDLLALYKRFAGRTDPVSGEFARCVLDAWSALEPDEQKKAALCVEVLGSDAAVEARSSMAWRLVRLKHPQRIPALLAAARDNDPRMQWAAIDVLGSVARETPGEAEPQIAAALIDLLKNAPDQTVRSRAAGALGNVADKAVVPALVAALKDPNHFVGASAAHSLGGLAGPEAIPALEEFAKGAEQKGQADAAKQAIERIKQRHP